MKQGSEYNDSKPESRRKVGRLEDVEDDLLELKFKIVKANPSKREHWACVVKGPSFLGGRKNN
jgi:hypothetical protein